MGTPSSTVRFRLSDGRSGRTSDLKAIRDYAQAQGLEVELERPAAPAPAPEAAPPRPAGRQYSVPETMARSALEGAAPGVPAFAAGAGGAAAAALQELQSGRAPNAPVRRPQPPAAGQPMARAGMGSGMLPQPLREAFAESYDTYRDETIAAEEQNPGTALATRFVTGIPMATAVPQAKAAQGAGLLARAGTGALNVAGDTAMAGAAGMLEGGADQGENAAKLGGAMSAGLRGAGGLGRAGLMAARGTGLKAAELLGIPASPEVSDAIKSFTREAPAGAPGTSGRAARDAAMQGADLDDAARSIQSDLNAMEDVRDAVLADSGVMLKPAKLAPRMARDGVTDAMGARVDSQQMVDDVELLAEHFLNESGRVKGLGSGYNALKKLQLAAQAYKQRVANLPQGEEGVAKVYSALDQFKRDVASAKKTALSGQSPDQGVSQALIPVYESIRGHLEDPAVWGAGTVEFQSNVNRAWTDAIPALKEFGQRFSSRAAEAAKAGDAFDKRATVGSENVAGFVNKAGSAGNADAEKALRAYLEQSPKLMQTLSDFYEVPPEVAGQLPAAREAAGRVAGSLDDVLRRGDASRRLGEIREGAPAMLMGAIPSPASVISMVGKGEQLAVNLEPKVAQSASVLTRSLSRSGGSAAGSQAPVSIDLVAQASVEKPEALGRFAPVIAKAMQRGKGHLQSYHSTLMQTDPEYQDLIRQLREANP